MELFNLNKKKADFIKIKVEKLVDWNEPNGDGCVVSDKITKEGFKVGYMYREKPEEEDRIVVGDFWLVMKTRNI